MRTYTMCFYGAITKTNIYIFSQNYHQILLLKGSIFLKNSIFIIQERFEKLIYGINTIIKCGT